jgi:hypothetical protein
MLDHSTLLAIILAVCAIAGGVQAIIYVLDYYGIIKPNSALDMTTTTNSNRRPSGRLVIFLLILTWAAVVFDVYDRHHSTPPPVLSNAAPQMLPTIPGTLVPGEPLYMSVAAFGWPKSKGHLKEVWNQNFVGASIPLDGYVYHHCTFEGCTLLYEGKLPTGGWVDSQLQNVSIETTDPGIKTWNSIEASGNINPATSCVLVPQSPQSLVH